MQEVSKKLDRYETPEEWKEEIILWLQENAFLDEERFARSYAYGKFRSNKWGKNKIRVYLKRLGLNENTVEDGLNEIDQEDYKNLIDKLIQKKVREVGSIKSMNEKQKVIRFLLQKGFEHDLFINRIH
ncbi:MAG: regulatory protein RecX [Bacteroidota bacterium]